MTTPTGTISLSDVNIELGFAGTTLISMNQSDVRTLAGVGGSGTIITMQNLQGKSNRVSLSVTYSSSTQSPTLNLSSISGYSAGRSDITVTVNSGVYLWSDSTGTPALNITGGTTGDTLTVVNNGFIMGKGGQGGSGGAANAGGTAINFGFGLAGATINNTNGSAYIGGGGGGGGGGNAGSNNYFGGGGGAGGGAGGNADNSAGGGGFQSGGAGGAIGSSGGNGGDSISGGGGGRIFPGAASSTSSFTAWGGQAGGRGGNNNGGGGGGGGSNNAGSNRNSSFGGGGGGGWGASGGSGQAAGGAAGGKAVNLNGKSVTWTSGDTTRVWGTVS